MAFVLDTKAETAAISVANPVTLAYTCGAGTKLLILLVSGQDNTGRTGGTPTYNLADMTIADSARAGEAECTAEIWYKINPTTGSEKTISVPNTGLINLRLHAISFTTTYDALANGATGTATTATNPSLTLNSVPKGAAVVSILASGYKDVPTGRTHTTIYPDDYPNWTAESQYTITTTAANVTMGFTQSSDDVAMVMASFKDDLLSVNVSDNVGVTDSPNVKIAFWAVAVFSLLGLTDSAEAVRSPLEVNVADNIGLTDSTAFSAFPLDESFTIHSLDNSTYATGFNRILARTSDGALHTVYIRTIGGYRQICYAKSIDEGETWSETVLTSGNYASTTCSIAVDSNDYIHVLFTGQLDGYALPQVRYLKYTTSWQVIENLTAEATYNHSGAGIAVDSSDNLHVIFQGPNASHAQTQIRYMKYDGESWSGITEISDDAYQQNRANICIDGNNVVHIFWEGLHSGSTTYNQIRHRKYTDSWQATENVTGDAYHSWDVWSDVDSDNNIHILFACTNEGSNTQISYMKYTVSWSEPLAITTGADYAQATGNVLIDGNNNVHLVWEGKHSGSATYYQLRYRLYDGTWQDIVNLTNEDSDQVFPRIIGARWPVIGGAKINRPATGFCFVYTDETDLDFRFFRSFDLTWDTPTFLVIQPADSIGITDYVNAEIPAGSLLSASVSDDISLTDEAQAQLTLYEAPVNDAVGLTDEVTGQLSLYEISVSDAVGLTDEVQVAENLYEIAVSDLVDVTDDVAAALNLYEIATYDLLALTDEVASQFNLYLAEVSDAIGLQDSAARLLDILLAEVSDDLAVTDDVLAALTLYEIVASDLLDVAEDTAAALTSYEALAYDSLALTDEGQTAIAGLLDIYVWDLVHIHPVYRRPNVGDTLGLSDEVNALLDILLVSVNDTVGLTDAVDVSIPVLAVSMIETIGLADEAALSVPILAIGVEDNVGIADEAIAALTFYEIAANDVVVATDDVIAEITGAGILSASVEDSFGLTDAVNVLMPVLLIYVADDLTVTDDVQVSIPVLHISAADDIGLSDDASASVPVLLTGTAETVGVNDSVDISVPVLTVDVADNATLTDEATASVPVLLVEVADTFAVSDEVAVSIPVLTASVSDTVSVEDATIEALARYEIICTDNIDVSEYVEGQIVGAGLLAANVNDTIGLTDSVAGGLNLYLLSASDNLTVTDSASGAFDFYQTSLADNVGVTDITAVSLVGAGLHSVNVNDAVAVTDAVAATLPLLVISAADDLGISDATTLEIPVVHVSPYDTIGLIDDVQIEIPGYIAEPNVNDLLALTDSASLAIALYPFLQAYLTVAATGSILSARDTQSEFDVADTGSVLTVTR